ncbi:hypothetical protein L3067_10825 [Xanthomonas sp. PPL568]|uniref:hypothetical protein n=1 Tax=Xanthomonas indica TaxID=2912242 RepID=UPI001F59E736|nr:hypothetical protein [Xanthomonas indica]MCI2245092.1 hypothetical protein [Xanthomonas indica]
MTSSDGTPERISEAELQTLQSVEAAPSGEPAFRFIQRCQEWFEKWLEANKHPLDANAIPATQILLFVFSETPDLEHNVKFKAFGTEYKRFFAGAHAQDTQGVILSNENFIKAYRLRTSLTSMDDAFDLVSANLKDDDAFVIAQLSQRRMLYHLPGGKIDDWCIDPVTYESRLSEDPLSADKIEYDVLEFHETSLKFAKNQIAKMVWVGKAQPYKLLPNPEQRIQSYLFLYLNASYKHLKGTVDEEIVGKGGRADIRVVWNSPPGSPYQPLTSTILELKVLVEGKGITHHKDWVTSGIKQADDYRRKDSEAVYTCVFDARKDQSDQMLDLDALATSKNVRLRRYLMEAPVNSAVAATTKAAKGSEKKTTKKATKNFAKKATAKR